MTDMELPGMTVVFQQLRLEAKVLRLLLAREYGHESDPHADAAAEHAEVLVRIAARDLVRAVDALPADAQPVGWAEPAMSRCCNGTGLADYAAVPCPAPDCPVSNTTTANTTASSGSASAGTKPLTTENGANQ